MQTQALRDALTAKELAQAQPRQRLAWSIETFAEACGICREGVYRAIREKRLKAKKFGNRTLIPEEAGRAFIAELPDLVLGDVAA